MSIYQINNDGEKWFLRHTCVFHQEIAPVISFHPAFLKPLKKSLRQKFEASHETGSKDI